MPQWMLHLFVVAAALAVAPAPLHAQQDRPWSVQSSEARDSRIVARYRDVLLREPDNAVAYRGLLDRVGRGPALAALVDDVRARAQAQTRPQPWILLGHLLRDHGRADESLAAYHEAVRTGPADPTAHAALGAALLRGGDVEAAQKSFEQALRLAGDGAPRRDLLRKLADAAAVRGDHSGAAGWLARLVADRPRDYSLRLELGEAQLRAQTFDAALESYQQARRLAGNNGKRAAQCLLDIGNLQRRLQNFPAAERAYREALALVGRANWMRREILVRLIEVARETASLGPMYAELQREWARPTYHDAMTLASLAEELSRDEDVVRWLERAAAIDPRAVEPRQRLIARFDHTAQADRVRGLYAEIARLRPRDHVHALERIEWLFLSAGQAEAAVSELRDLQRRRAGDVDALVDIARTWRRFGMPDAAVAVHVELDRTQPTSPRHLEAYGELLAALGRSEEAWTVWDRLLAGDRGVTTRLRVAELAARHRQHERAIALLESAVADAPTYLDARQRLAGLYEAVEDWPAALREWERLFFEHGIDHAGARVVAISRRTSFLGDRALSPDDGLLARWEAYFAREPRPRVGVILAQLRFAMTRDDGGLELVRQIAAVDPAELPVTEHLAWIEAGELLARRLAERDPLAAIDALARIADAFGDRRAELWHRAVELALPLDDVRAARGVVERALAAVPNDARVHALAGAFFGARGESHAAVRHLERAVTLGVASHEVYFDLAFHLTEQGQTDRARATYLALLRADWSGAAATSAAFSAIDLCESDADLFEVEAAMHVLRGRLDAGEFLPIAVAVYHELFVHAQAPEAAFRAVGQRALPLVVAALQSEEWSDRERAAALLALYPGEEVARAALAAWPAQPHTWNADMVWSLARTRASVVGKALVGALDSDDGDARRAAIYGIGYARIVEGAPKLAERLGSPDLDDEENMLALAALSRLGGEFLRELDAIAANEGARAETRIAALWAIGQAADRDAAAVLSRRLSDREPRVARFAAVVLRQIVDEAALAELLRAAWAPEVERRQMGALGLRAERAAQVMWSWDEPVLSHPERLVARSLAALVAVSGDGPMGRAFIGREASVIRLAAPRLRRKPDPHVLAHLLEVANERDEASASSVKVVVAGLRPELRRLARSTDRELVLPAAMLLPVAQDDADVAVVVEAAGALRSDEAAQVVARLEAYRWEAVRGVVTERLSSHEPRQRAAALRVLRRHGARVEEPDVTRLAEQLLDDPDDAVRLAAVDAVGALGLESSVARLEAVFAGAPPIQRLAVRRALEQIDGDAARRALLRLAIEPIRPPCKGDPHDLDDLLRDACVGPIEVSEF